MVELDEWQAEEMSGLSEDEALRRMYRITMNYQRSYEQKRRELLEVGRTYLSVEIGFLTEISDDTQRIVETSGNHELLTPGESCPLSNAYCRKTVRQEGALTVQHAAVDGWEGDTAYELFGLESYIGARVVVDGELYGTFCFADSEPRNQPFSETEETFVELMSKWVSYELFQQRAKARIESQRDRLEEFASTVSHDLRNPLSVAKGYLELAEETGDAEQFQQCRSALDRMSELIGDLLILAREGKEIDGAEDTHIPTLVKECWSFVSNDTATISVTADLTVTGDRSRLQQLFGNLFRNAIQHGDEDVTVRVGQLDDENGIYIEDDGPGIPEEKRHRVFDDGYSTGESGTGYGLAIVKQVVEAHGWDIQVTDTAGGGARFEITGVEDASC